MSVIAGILVLFEEVIQILETIATRPTSETYGAVFRTWDGVKLKTLSG